MHPPNRQCRHSVHLWEQKGGCNQVAWVPFLSLLAKRLASPCRRVPVSRRSSKRNPFGMPGNHLESKLEAVPVHAKALPLGSLQTPVASALAVSFAGSGTTPKRQKKYRRSGSTGEHDLPVSVPVYPYLCLYLSTSRPVSLSLSM